MNKFVKFFSQVSQCLRQEDLLAVPGLQPRPGAECSCAPEPRLEKVPGGAHSSPLPAQSFASSATHREPLP